MRLLLLLAFAIPASAQRLVLATNDNDTFNPGSAIGWPSSTVAMRFLPSANMTATAAEIFTGNGAGTNRLAIWSHDAVNDRPLVPLAPAASWSMLPVRCWQGTTLATPIPLAAGQTYWLVWDVVNFAQNSVAASSTPANVEVRVSSNGGTSWNASVTWAAKLRIYEASATGAITAYGTAKPGVYGNPSIGVSGWPTVGNPLDVWVHDTAAATPCLLIVGVPTNIPLGFATLWVDLQVTVFLSTLYVNSPVWRGSLSHTLRVPNTPSAVGFPLSFQWGIFDGAAAEGLSHTAAVTALLQ
ncbi:MAG: hypothetical protein ABIP94_08750 [Planctomycetota bacterium]